MFNSKISPVPMLPVDGKGRDYQVVHPSCVKSTGPKTSAKSRMYLAAKEIISTKIDKHVTLNQFTTNDLLNLKYMERSGELVIMHIKGKSCPILFDAHSFPAFLNSKLKEGLLNRDLFRTRINGDEMRTLLKHVLDSIGEDLVKKLMLNVSEKIDSHSLKSKVIGMGSGVVCATTAALANPAFVIGLVGGCKAENSRQKAGAYSELKRFYTECICLSDPKFKLKVQVCNNLFRHTISMDIVSKVNGEAPILFLGYSYQSKYCLKDNLAKLAEKAFLKLGEMDDVASGWSLNQMELIDLKIIHALEELVCVKSKNNPFYISDSGQRAIVLDHALIGLRKQSVRKVADDIDLNDIFEPTYDRLEITHLNLDELGFSFQEEQKGTPATDLMIGVNLGIDDVFESNPKVRNVRIPEPVES
ncbi:hypothetical protein HOG98_07560 [bacterium]|jgi:hypothetical protein|nr:hypothetical protein [bacterium]